MKIDFKYSNIVVNFTRTLKYIKISIASICVISNPINHMLFEIAKSLKTDPTRFSNMMNIFITVRSLNFKCSFPLNIHEIFNMIFHSSDIIFPISTKFP